MQIAQHSTTQLIMAAATILEGVAFGIAANVVDLAFLLAIARRTAIHDVPNTAAIFRFLAALIGHHDVTSAGPLAVALVGGTLDLRGTLCLETFVVRATCQCPSRQRRTVSR